MTEEKESEVQEKTNSTKPQEILGQFLAMPPRKRIAFLVFFGIAILALIYLFFFSNKEDKKPIDNINNSISSTVAAQPFNEVYKPKAERAPIPAKAITLKPPVPLAPPPPLEPIKEEPSVPIPEAVISIASPALPVPEAKKNMKDTLSEAQASGISVTNIMTFGGGEGTSTGANNTATAASQTAKKDTGGFLGFDGGLIDGGVLQPSSAKKVAATKIDNNLAYTIVQGKILDAVLETAINTQMQAGVIRAIVSRDVYGEQGDVILIPKGSRLVGGYSTTTESSNSGGGGNAGYSGGAQAMSTRVFAAWNRIITPSGVDINLSATPATDSLGRSGIPGYLDTNLTNNLMNAFLVSVLGPYVATVITGTSKELVANNNNNNNNNNNDNNLSGPLGAKVLSDGIQKFQDVGKEYLNKIYPPGVTTIYVDQGTKIDIIVQEDIVFPREVTNNAQRLP